MEKKYLYKGAEYSRSELEAKYGQNTDQAIEKFGFELVEDKKKPKEKTASKKKDDTQAPASVSPSTSGVVDFSSGSNPFEKNPVSRKPQETQSGIPQEVIEKATSEFFNNKINTPLENEKRQPHNFGNRTENPVDRDVLKNKYNEGFKDKNKEIVEKNSLKKPENIYNPVYQQALNMIDKDGAEQRYHQALEQSSIWDKTKKFFRDVHNTLSGHPSYEIEEPVPLEAERKQAIEILKQENPDIEPTETQINEKAKDIFIDNDIQKQLHGLVDKFLPAGYDREGIFKELKFKSLQNNDILRSIIATAEMYKAQIMEFTEYAETIDSKNVTKEQAEKYNSLYQKAVSANGQLETLSQNFDKFLEEANTDEEKLELFKYNYNDWEKFFKTIGAGFVNIAGGTLKLAGGIHNAVNSINPLLSKEEKMKVGQVASDKGSDLLKYGEELTSEFYRYSASDINSWSDFGSVSAQVISEQLPILLTMWLGGGTGLVGVAASSGGAKIHELEEEEKNTDKVYTQGEKLTAGLLFAGSEFIFERLGTFKIFQNIKNTYRSASNAARKEIKKGALKQITNSLGKTIKTTATETLTERATTESQIFIDENYLDKEFSDKEKSDMRTESDFASALMGLGFSVIGGSVSIYARQAKALSNRSSIKEVNLRIAKINNYIKEIQENKSLTKEEKNGLFKAINILNDQVSAIMEKSAGKGLKFSTEEKALLLKTTSDIDALNSELKSVEGSNLSDDIKQARKKDISERINELETQKEALLNNVDLTKKKPDDNEPPSNNTGGAMVLEKSGEKSEQTTYSESKQTDHNGIAFIESSSSGIDLGVIDEQTSQEIGGQSAPVRLSKGTNKYGLEHIDIRHGDEIADMGYENSEAFVDDVVKNYTEIRDGNNGALLLVKRNGNDKLAAVQLKPSENGDYYTVITAFASNKKHIEKQKLLSLGKSSPSDAVATKSDFKKGQQQGNAIPLGPTDNNNLLSDKDTNKSETTKQSENGESNVQRMLDGKPPVYDFSDIKPVGSGFFGNIYDQFKGKAREAIAFLMQKKEGEATGALHHKDVGDIDIVWGNEGTGKSDGGGLSKIVKFHPEVLNNLQEIINETEITSSSENRIRLESEKHQAVVRLDWDGNNKKWLLTAFEKGTSTTNSRTTDIAKTQKKGKNDTAPLSEVDVKENSASANRLNNETESVNSDNRIDKTTPKSEVSKKVSETANTLITPDSNKGGRYTVASEVGNSDANIEQKSETTPNPPKEITRGKLNKIINRLTKAIPSIKGKVIVDQKRMESRLSELENRGENAEKIENQQGEVLGFVDPKDGRIYLNPKRINADTPFHEIAGHTFLNIAKQHNPKVYNAIIDKLKGEKALMDQVRNDPNYSHLKTDEQIADELFARMVGNKGEALFEAMENRDLSQKIRDYIAQMWENLKKQFGYGEFNNIRKWSVDDFKNATINEIVDNVSKDALQGKKIVSEEVGKNKNSIKEKIGDLFDIAQRVKNRVIKEVIRPVSKEEARTIKEKTGIEVDENFEHTIDNYAINHILNRHGNAKSEAKHGQIGVTKSDIELIPDIIDNYDFIEKSKNERGQETIKYVKTYPDGTTYYFEELRVGKKELAGATMYKKKNKEGVKLLADNTPTTPNVQNDPLVGKDTNKSETTKQSETTSDNVQYSKATPEGNESPKDENEKKKKRDIVRGRLKRFLHNSFYTGSGLHLFSDSDANFPEIVKGLERGESAIIDGLKQDTNLLRLTIKEARKSMKEANKKEVSKEINDYLTGKSTGEKLSAETKERLEYFRSRVDDLSSDVIDVLDEKINNLKDKQSKYKEGTPYHNSISEQIETAQKLINTINENKGKYLNRSYQAFTDKKYIDGLTLPYDKMTAKNRRLIDNAVNYLVKEQGLTKVEARDVIADYLDNIKRKGDPLSFMDYLKGRAGSDFLKGRKELPQEFLDLLGEIKDPMHNYINTIYNVSKYLESLKYQEALREALVSSGVGRFSPELGYTKLASDTKEWSLLSDLYVPNEFAVALRDAMPLESVKDAFMRAMVIATGVTKVGKTVFSPTTTSRNFLSGILLGLNSGHFFMFNPKEALASMHQAWGSRLVHTNAEAKRFRAELLVAGVIGDGANAGDIRALMNDISKEVNRLLSRNAVKKTGDFAQNVYKFGDDFYKVFGYITEKARLIGSGMDDIEAGRVAGERVRGGYPTYSYLPRNAKLLRRFPLMASFVSFPYEVVRTTKNNILYMLEDFRDGRLKMGFKRLAGIMSASAGLQAISVLTSTLYGIGDNDEEAIREFLPEYQRNNLLIFMGKDKKGNPKFIDASALAPSETFMRPVMTAIGKRSNYDSAMEQVTAGFIDFAKPYTDLDVLTNTIVEQLSDRDGRGQKISSELDGFQTFKNRTHHFMRGAGPGVYNNVAEFMRANGLMPSYFGEKITNYGREYTNEDALLALLGIRGTTFNYGSAMIFAGYQIGTIRDEMRRDMVKSLKVMRALSDAEIKVIFDKNIKRLDKVSVELKKKMDAGITFGMSEADLLLALKSGVGIMDVAYISATGKVFPDYINKGDLESFVTNNLIVNRDWSKKDIENDNEAKEKMEKELEDYFVKNIEKYMELVGNYLNENKPAEQNAEEDKRQSSMQKSPSQNTTQRNKKQSNMQRRPSQNTTQRNKKQSNMQRRPSQNTTQRNKRQSNMQRRPSQNTTQRNKRQSNMQRR